MPAGNFPALAGILVFLLVGIATPRADSLPWIMLDPAEDTRDPEMRTWDRADSRYFVEAANRSEAFAGRRFRWVRAALDDVLAFATSFAELRFDAVKPMAFTPHEKNVLQEWLVRGGFLLLVEDTYPYTQDVFRKNPTLPVYEFFTRELPSRDPRFTVERITDAHPIFHIGHATSTVPALVREMRENPHYRGRTLILHDGRPVAFFMGRYNYEENNLWVPMARPFPSNYQSDLRAYYLIVNIYIYAMCAPGSPRNALP